MKKYKFLIMLSLLVMIAIFFLTVNPSYVNAATEGDYTYTVENGEAMITYYNGFGSDVTIPSMLGGYSVTTISDGAFYHCVSLTSVTIPDSVTTIGSEAFYWCDSLTNLWVDENNTAYSSDDCGVLYNKNKTILIYMPRGFSGGYTIPDGVISIGDKAFNCCLGLTSVNIPDSVTTVGEDTFLGCEGLTTVTIPDSVTTIGVGAFFYCDGLTSITIGDSVTVIGDSAFDYCTSLTSVNVGNSVSVIGSAAFDNCLKLNDVYYNGTQSQWEAVSVGAGNNCLQNATMHFVKDLEAPDAADYTYTVTNGKTTIVGYIGAGGDITIPTSLGGYSVTAIGNEAFSGNTSLISVTIPDSITTIGECAFEFCSSLASVKIGDGVITIGFSAFGDCDSLASVTISNSVTTIGDCAFYGCYSLKTIMIPNSVTAIGEFAFAECDMLKSVYLESGVKIIGHAAFAWCNSLSDVYYGGSAAQWGEIAIDDNEELLEANIHFKEEHTHGYTKKVTKPTCIAKGYTTYTCSCGDTYKDNYVNVTSHSYAAATCTKPKTCKVCKATSGKALGHSYKSGSCIRCKYKPAGAKITTQPVNVAVKNGKTAKVTVKATGSGLKYTWYYAKKGAKSYTKTNVTSSSYSVKMSNSINGGKVYCVVTDQYGNSVKSNVVTLYKGTAVKITTQPKSTTVANGKSGSLTIKASGSSLKYQWYIKYKGASSFTKVGKSSKTYSFKMASKLNGAQVYCVVKDKYGIEVKSSVVTLKMPVQPKITTQPKSAKAFSGKTVKFTVKASGEGLKYQWYYAKKGSSSFKKLSAKSATYSVKVSSSVNGRKYYCLVTDKYGQTVKSSVVTLTMQQAAKITTQPKNVSVKNNKTAKVTIKATGDGIKYTWYYLLPGTTKYQKASATGNTFSVKMSAKYKNCKVYCMVSDQYGNSVKSKTVTLKMK